MKILIMGLPGSGKTTLALNLLPLLNAKWVNADNIRKTANDWDFSKQGRVRQAKRMVDAAEQYKKEGYIVVADFICPTPEARKIFNPDYIIWLDTIEKGRFEDTNKIFVKPKKYDFKITTLNAKLWAIQIADKIMPYIWDNKINNEYEYLVSIKTVDILKNKIVEIIKQIHNYKVPEIISYKINIINKDYKLWCEDIIKT